MGAARSLSRHANLDDTKSRHHVPCHSSPTAASSHDGRVLQRILAFADAFHYQADASARLTVGSPHPSSGARARDTGLAENP
jgi:hypothetical protein